MSNSNVHAANRPHEEIKKPKTKTKVERVTKECIKCKKPYSITKLYFDDLKCIGMVPNPMCKSCQKEVAQRARTQAINFHNQKV